MLLCSKFDFKLNFNEVIMRKKYYNREIIDIKLYF